MYLKSVEIHGFKSFANKMVLSFGSGITGIVGPNGSGKSNVADAVRWVLGEQSAKQLRGSKMEDVIFAGTKVKKAQSFAYVAITLDNRDQVLPIDYEEVVVARRVYRSGESEYLINGNQCRLRDVQDIFLDTGIGKEGYSIIGQGQIEKILSGKPEDRRELFDEAAGITKFKKRKATAVKHLEEEAANLERVNDILSELERQVLPLKEQAEKAKLFLGYRDELKKFEIHQFISEYDKAEDGSEALKRDYEIAESSLNSVNGELERTKAGYEAISNLLEEKTVEAEELSNRISDEKLERERLESQINVTVEKMKAAKQGNASFHERLKKEENKIASLLKDEKEEEGKAESFRSSISCLKESIEETEKKLSEMIKTKQRLEEQRQRNQEEGLRFEKEKAEAGGLISLYTTNVEQIKIKRLELNQKILRNKEGLQSLQQRLDTTDKNLAEINSAMTEIQENIESLLSLVASLKGTRTEKEKLYRTKEKEILTAKAVLSSMKNMALRYDGYGNSVKHIMELKKEEKGIIGVVADIIKVKESYELAIETAMGASIQNIVTDKEETAKRTIAYLKERKLGRATFLPLDAMGLHNPGNFGGALNEKGILGVASALVEFEPRFAGVISHILGRTLVADTMDTATKIARKYKYSLRIVTLDGEQLNPGGSISGGAYKNANHLLGRAREIEEKEKDLQLLEEDLALLTKEGNDINYSIKENQKSIEIYKQRISDLKIQKNTEINSKQQLNERMAELDKGSAEIWLDADQLDREKENALSEIERLEGILKAEGRVCASLLKEVEREISQSEEEIKKEKADLQKKEVDLAGLTSNLNFVQANIDRIHKDIMDATKEIKELSETNQNFESYIADNEALLVEIREKINQLSFVIVSDEAKKDEVSKEREKLTLDNKRLIDEREGLSETKNQLEKEMLRLTNALEKVENTLAGLVEYMREEYGLTYSEIVKHYERSEEVPSSALKKMIANQKNLIKELGAVNVNSIEEYKDVKERYEELKVQHDDIVEAELTLRNVIEELDKKMREQFNTSFKEINQSFDQTFAELFGGGGGRLELMEGEDILEAGIKIIAEPPGKKLQNMMQLSGGEKALTAIALLFAIQNLKPSPFCLLDEIEAALDDSNVVRFAAYLNKLTRNTQFIVITHRRGTMNAADVLYGITMQEKGVSTMVSVNLIEAELSN